MNAEQKLRHQILFVAARSNRDIPFKPDMTIDEINEIFDGEEFSDDIHDASQEVRPGEITTDIPCDYSRHYESNSVAAKMPDGSWVGWTYWYGGGKHGEPEAVDWIEYAYPLNCVEEQRMVTVRTFTKAEEANP